jgi:RNA polymerase sigma-70 factor (ECF subfamily)
VASASQLHAEPAGCILVIQGVAQMAADSTSQLQILIDSMAAGDPSARDELIARAHERLQRLAKKIFKGFERLRSIHDSGDVLPESMPRLMRAVERDRPATVRDFFQIAAREMRCQLLNEIRRYFGPEGPGGKHESPGWADQSSSNDPPAEQAPSSESPPTLAYWTEFHEAVEKLPAQEREVFSLLWYHELTQEEAAAVLHRSEATVRRWWLSARRKLGAMLRDMHAD